MELEDAGSPESAAKIREQIVDLEAELAAGTEADTEAAALMRTMEKEYFRLLAEGYEKERAAIVAVSTADFVVNDDGTVTMPMPRYEGWSLRTTEPATKEEAAGMTATEFEEVEVEVDNVPLREAKEKAERKRDKLGKQFNKANEKDSDYADKRTALVDAMDEVERLEAELEAKPSYMEKKMFPKAKEPRQFTLIDPEGNELGVMTQAEAEAKLSERFPAATMEERWEAEEFPEGATMEERREVVGEAVERLDKALIEVYGGERTAMDDEAKAYLVEEIVRGERTLESVEKDIATLNADIKEEAERQAQRRRAAEHEVEVGEANAARKRAMAGLPPMPPFRYGGGRLVAPEGSGLAEVYELLDAMHREAVGKGKDKIPAVPRGSVLLRNLSDGSYLVADASKLESREGVTGDETLAGTRKTAELDVALEPGFIEGDEMAAVDAVKPAARFSDYRTWELAKFHGLVREDGELLYPIKAQRPVTEGITPNDVRLARLKQIREEKAAKEAAQRRREMKEAYEDEKRIAEWVKMNLDEGVVNALRNLNKDKYLKQRGGKELTLEDVVRISEMLNDAIEESNKAVYKENSAVRAKVKERLKAKWEAGQDVAATEYARRKLEEHLALRRRKKEKAEGRGVEQLAPRAGRDTADHGNLFARFKGEYERVPFVPDEAVMPKGKTAQKKIKGKVTVAEILAAHKYLAKVLGPKKKVTKRPTRPGGKKNVVVVPVGNRAALTKELRALKGKRNKTEAEIERQNELAELKAEIEKAKVIMEELLDEQAELRSSERKKETKKGQRRLREIEKEKKKWVHLYESTTAATLLTGSVRGIEYKAYLLEDGTVMVPQVSTHTGFGDSKSTLKILTDQSQWHDRDTGYMVEWFSEEDAAVKGKPAMPLTRAEAVKFVESKEEGEFRISLVRMQRFTDAKNQDGKTIKAQDMAHREMRAFIESNDTSSGVNSSLLALEDGTYSHHAGRKHFDEVAEHRRRREAAEAAKADESAEARKETDKQVAAVRGLKDRESSVEGSKNMSGKDKEAAEAFRQAIIDFITLGGRFHGLAFSKIKVVDNKRKALDKKNMQGKPGDAVFVKSTEPDVIFVNPILLRRYYKVGDNGRLEPLKGQGRPIESVVHEELSHLLDLQTIHHMLAKWRQAETAPHNISTVDGYLKFMYNQLNPFQAQAVEKRYNNRRELGSGNEAEIAMEMLRMIREGDGVWLSTEETFAQQPLLLEYMKNARNWVRHTFGTADTHFESGGKRRQMPELIAAHLRTTERYLHIFRNENGEEVAVAPSENFNKFEVETAPFIKVKVYSNNKEEAGEAWFEDTPEGNKAAADLAKREHERLVKMIGDAAPDNWHSLISNPTMRNRGGSSHNYHAGGDALRRKAYTRLRTKTMPLMHDLVEVQMSDADKERISPAFRKILEDNGFKMEELNWGEYAWMQAVKEAEIVWGREGKDGSAGDSAYWAYTDKRKLERRLKAGDPEEMAQRKATIRLTGGGDYLSEAIGSYVYQFLKKTHDVVVPKYRSRVRWLEVDTTVYDQNGDVVGDGAVLSFPMTEKGWKDAQAAARKRARAENGVDHLTRPQDREAFRLIRRRYQVGRDFPPDETSGGDKARAHAREGLGKRLGIEGKSKELDKAVKSPVVMNEKGEFKAALPLAVVEGGKLDNKAGGKVDGAWKLQLVPSPSKDKSSRLRSEYAQEFLKQMQKDRNVKRNDGVKRQYDSYDSVQATGLGREEDGTYSADKFSDDLTALMMGNAAHSSLLDGMSTKEELAARYRQYQEVMHGLNTAGNSVPASTFGSEKDANDYVASLVWNTEPKVEVAARSPVREEIEGVETEEFVTETGPMYVGQEVIPAPSPEEASAAVDAAHHANDQGLGMSGADMRIARQYHDTVWELMRLEEMYLQGGGLNRLDSQTRAGYLRARPEERANFRTGLLKGEEVTSIVKRLKWRPVKAGGEPISWRVSGGKVPIRHHHGLELSSLEAQVYELFLDTEFDPEGMTKEEMDEFLVGEEEAARRVAEGKRPLKADAILTKRQVKQKLEVLMKEDAYLRDKWLTGGQLGYFEGEISIDKVGEIINTAHQKIHTAIQFEEDPIIFGASLNESMDSPAHVIKTGEDPHTAHDPVSTRDDALRPKFWRPGDWSAVDALKGYGIEAVEKLGHAIDLFYDTEAALFGQHMAGRSVLMHGGFELVGGDKHGRTRHGAFFLTEGKAIEFAEKNEWQGYEVRVVEPYTKAQLAKAEAEAAEYFRVRERGDKHDRETNEAIAEHYLTATTEATKNLVKWVKNEGIETGYTLKKNDVRAFNSKTGKWEPIKHLFDQHWPRMFKQSTWEVINNPARYPEEYDKMLKAMVDNGNAKDFAGAKKILQDYLHGINNPTEKGDFFANMEKARGYKLPDEFYDYSMTAYYTYMRRYSARTAQIIAFGQGAGTQKRPKTAWEYALESVGTDQARKYIAKVHKSVYRSYLNDDGLFEMISRTALPATAVTYLSGPLTAIRNTTFALRANAESFGTWQTMGAALKGLMSVVTTNASSLRKDGELSRPQFVGEAEALGLLRSDWYVARELAAGDDAIRTGKMQKYNEAMSWAQKYALWMQRTTEEFNRSVTATMALQHLRRTREKWRTDPHAKDTVQHMAMIKRMSPDIDIEALMAEDEEGHWKPDPDVRDRFLRDAVFSKQYGYNVRQHPLFLDTPTGRILFQFQKWGFQRTRDFARNVWQPMAKGTTVTLPDGRTETVRDAKPLLRNLFLIAAQGELYATILMSFFYDRERDELIVPLSAKNDEVMMGLGERIQKDLIYDGGLGIVTDYISWFDPADTRPARWKQTIPLNPPAYSLIEDVTLMGKDIVHVMREDTDLGAKKDAVLSTIEKTMQKLPLIRAVGVPLPGTAPGGLGYTARRMFDIEDYALRVQDGRKDVKVVRAAARRFAKDNGYEDARVWSGGRAVQTEKRELYWQLNEALLAGDKEKARQIRDRLVAGRTGRERKAVLSAIKASVRSRQPILLDGKQPTDKVQREFLRWVKKELPEHEERITRIHKDYWKAAAAAGVK